MNILDKTNSIGKSIGKLTYIPILIILGLSLVTIIVSPYIIPAKAYTNGIYTQERLTVCVSVATCNGITSINTNIGDLVILSMTCSPGTVNVNSIIDSNGDTFNLAQAITDFPTTGGQPSVSQSIYYTSSAKSTSTGAFTLTLSSTATGCGFYANDVNTQSTGYLNPQSAISVANDLISGGLIQTLIVSANNKAPANTYFISISTDITSSGSYPNPLATPTAPLIAEYCQTIFSNCYFSTISDSIISDTFQVNPFSGNFLITTGAVNPHTSLLTVLLAFATSGVGSTCTSSNAILTQTNANKRDNGNYLALTSNITYANIFYNSGQTIITSIQVNVKSANPVIFGNPTKLTLGLYQSLSMPPTSASPAILIPLQRQTWDLTLNNNPQNFTLNLGAGVTIPTNYYGIITLGVSHQGISVYNSTTSGSPISTDTTDSFSNKIPPTTLTGMNLNKANIVLFGNLLLPCTTKIIQTQTTTQGTLPNNNGGSLTGSNSGAVILQGLINYLPVWILPALMTAMLGMAGFLYGMVFALLIGIYIGLFPYWVIFIMVVMIYLLLR